MPGPDEQDLLDFGFKDTQTQQPQTGDDELWTGFAVGKKDKKEKKKLRAQTEEQDEAPNVPVVAPSPPTNGVSLQAPPSPVLELEPARIEPDASAVPEPELETYWNDVLEIPEEAEPPRPPAPKPSPLPPTRSPRPAVAKPASPAVSPAYRKATLYGSPPYANLPSHPRRESFQTQTARPRFVEPPLPHLPQAHFFGAPDLGFGLSSGAKQPAGGKLAGSDNYCCTFDTFADAGDAASAKKVRDALLVGSEGGLDVYRVIAEKLEVVGRLEGLRGAVIGAKILPHVERYDTSRVLRPLIAVIVHGVVEERQDSGQEDDGLAPSFKYWQTTVEVYSLQAQKHIATLYQSATVSVERPVRGELAVTPKPVGELSLDAKGSFITVASGRSGEVFVFSSASTTSNSDDLPPYRLVGKFWTSLQTPADRPASTGDTTTSLTQAEQPARIPLLSLSARWLAIVAPYASTGISIQGSPLLSASNTQPLGLSSHTATAQPPITCEVVGTDAEGTLSWLSRKTAQGVVKGAQSAYHLGKVGWQELTHPTPVTADGRQRSASRATDEGRLFPPTNGVTDDPRARAEEPSLVSIIDLTRLLELETAGKVANLAAPVVLATFAFAEGCNFLSLSPDGVRMCTANRKGEVSTIWDLAHIAHGSALPPGNSAASEVERGPHVRQVHRISRTSPSTVVDAVWTRDADAMALLTEHGTVHLHNVPAAPLVRKRKRRGTYTDPAPSLPEKADPVVGVSHASSPPSSNGGGVWGSIRTWGQSVSTSVSAVRSQAGGVSTFLPKGGFDGLRETAVAARVVGGRAVARGVSAGFSAARSGVGDVWYKEENKVRMKVIEGEESRVKRGCVRWIRTGAGELSLAVFERGSVRLMPVQRVVRRKGDIEVPGLRVERRGEKSFQLPHITAGKGTCDAEGVHGFWSLPSASIEIPRSARGSATVGGGTTEVETNPPYCPFHVDLRVGIFAFEDVGLQLLGHDVDEDVWVFGGPLPKSTRVNVRIGSSFDEERKSVGVGSGEVEGEMDGLAEVMSSRMTMLHRSSGLEGGEGEQEIRVNTQRTSKRKGKGRSPPMELDAEGDTWG